MSHSPVVRGPHPANEIERDEPFPAALTKHATYLPSTFRTCPTRHRMSVLGSRADIINAVSDFRWCPGTEAVLAAVAHLNTTSILKIAFGGLVFAVERAMGISDYRLYIGKKHTGLILDHPQPEKRVIEPAQLDDRVRPSPRPPPGKGRESCSWAEVASPRR